MDKEKIITIVLGLVVGIVLAAAYFFGSKFLPNFNKQSKSTAATTKRVSAPEKNIDKEINLSLTSPDDNSSTINKSVKLSGVFLPNSQMIIFANADEQVATSDAKGQFNFDVSLETGENEITVNSFDKKGKLVSIKRNVTLEATQ